MKNHPYFNTQWFPEEGSMRPYLGRAQLPSEETVCRAASGQFAGVGVGRHENTRLSTAEARMGSARGGSGGEEPGALGAARRAPKPS